MAVLLEKNDVEVNMERAYARNFGTELKDKGDELTLFFEMRRREKENEKNNLLLFHNSDESGFDAPLGNKPGDSPISKIVSSMPVSKNKADEFMDSENDKTDYDWLLTPPGTPLFPSLEMDSQKTVMGQNGISNGCPTALKSRLSNHQTEPTATSNIVPRNQSLPSGLNSSSVTGRRPSLTTSTSATTERTALPAIVKSTRSSTPTPHSTFPSTKPIASTRRSATPTERRTLPAAVKPTRSSTPTSRSTFPSTKASAPSVRSTTPRSTPRSSTPTARTSVPASKSTPRSATPTRQASNPLSAPIVSAPPDSSSLTKPGLTTLKNPVPPRGASPTVKCRPRKPSEVSDFSLDAPPNLRTSMPERPASASRGRSGAPSARSSSGDAGSKGRRRRQSCSPSRGKGSSGSTYSTGGSTRASTKLHSNGSDDVSPVLMGTKMVERVVNMRKLAPPKQDDYILNNVVGKSSSSPSCSGFGLTLSKKSLDMAMRHMDIRRTSGNLRPIMTNIPASSMYSVKSGSTKSRTTSVSDSPHATSSNAGSELSVNCSSVYVEANDKEDSITRGEIGNPFPASEAHR